MGATSFSRSAALRLGGADGGGTGCAVAGATPVAVMVVVVVVVVELPAAHPTEVITTEPRTMNGM